MKLDEKVPKLIMVIKILVIINIVLAIAAFYEFKTQKVPSFGAVYKSQGKTYATRMVPLSKPIITRQSVLEFASEAAVAAYTYDVANYQTQLQQTIDKYFTSNGGDALMQAFENSGALDKLLSSKLVVTSVVNGAPLLLRQGYLFGNETWRVQIPILVNYQSASELETDAYIVSMLITRIPTTEKATGIGITQFKVNRAIITR